MPTDQIIAIACVAGGALRASAFVLVAKSPHGHVNASGEAVRVLVKSRNMAAPPPLARSRIPPGTQAINRTKLAKFFVVCFCWLF